MTTRPPDLPRRAAAQFNKALEPTAGAVSVRMFGGMGAFMSLAAVAQLTSLGIIRAS
jgi:hypothetical protein